MGTPAITMVVSQTTAMQMKANFRVLRLRDSGYMMDTKRSTVITVSVNTDASLLTVDRSPDTLQLQE